MSLAPHALAALVLTAASLFLLSRDRIPMEYSCAAILTVMVVIFELFPVPGPEPLRGADFLRGFGNEALITICLLLMLARAIEFSGALRPVGRFLTRVWLINRSLALLATLLVIAFISAFLNNTPVVVMMLPILVGVAHHINLAPSKMLIPVGFATIIGGMSTTIGTSTNLLVVNVSQEMGLERLHIFDFVVPAAFAALIGILYLWLIAPRILPSRAYPLQGTEPRVFDSVMTIGENSPFAAQTLSSVVQKLGKEVRVAGIRRGDALELARLPTLTLLAGDRLHLRGTPEAIRLAHEKAGGTSPTLDIRHAPDERLVEIVVTRDSPLHFKRLSVLQQDTLRGLYPVGWYRPRAPAPSPGETNSDPLLRTGDILLMQGNRHEIQKLIDTSHILVLARSIHVPRTSKAPLAIGVMIGVVLVASLGIVPIIAAALAGVGIMLLGRCLTWNEAFDAVDTRLALVIVVSLALGNSLVGTGAAQFLAQEFVDLTGNLPAPIVLSGLLLVTALLTEIVTNNAVAVIATPIAMSVATELSEPALPFVLAVLFGANMSYLTPIGYQTNLLVMSAGGYRFSDFFRAGLPLQIIMWLALSLLLPVLYL